MLTVERVKGEDWVSWVQVTTDEKREAIAEQIRTAPDIVLPDLPCWNDRPCGKHLRGHKPTSDCVMGDRAEECAEGHSRPVMGCRKCGIELRKHQRIAVAWLYAKRRALLSDSVGLGKTGSCAGMLAVMRERGELGRNNKALVVCRSAATEQWRDELVRMIPDLKVALAVGTPQQRQKIYTSPFEVMVMTPQLVNNDVIKLSKIFNFETVIVDDIDVIRHPDKLTAVNLGGFLDQAERVVIATATPLQKELIELHAVYSHLGGPDMFGSVEQFKADYHRVESVRVFPRRKNGNRYGAPIIQRKTTGYKNLDKFRDLIVPYTLRRTADELDDVELPSISPNEVYLELYPEQRKAYQELRAGILKVEQENGELGMIEAMQKVHAGAKICAGLGGIEGYEDGPGKSVKMDWVMGQLKGDLKDEKIVLFVHYQESVRQIQNRFAAEGVDYVTMWSKESSKKLRKERIARFWDDPDCKVLIGTTTIEQSLNLQVARHLICFDIIPNAARVQQLAGRVRRTGSAFKTVFVHFLWALDTQEDKYKPALEREQALADHVWDETQELFDALEPTQLVALIGA